MHHTEQLVNVVNFMTFEENKKYKGKIYSNVLIISLMLIEFKFFGPGADTGISSSIIHIQVCKIYSTCVAQFIDWSKSALGVHRKTL